MQEVICLLTRLIDKSSKYFVFLLGALVLIGALGFFTPLWQLLKVGASDRVWINFYYGCGLEDGFWVDTPSVINPIEGSVVGNSTLTVTKSSHENQVRWQIEIRDENDNVIYDQIFANNGDSQNINIQTWEEGDYKVRVRYEAKVFMHDADRFGWSNWSDSVNFSIKKLSIELIEPSSTELRRFERFSVDVHVATGGDPNAVAVTASFAGNLYPLSYKETINGRAVYTGQWVIGDIPDGSYTLLIEASDGVTTAAESILINIQGEVRQIIAPAPIS